MILPLVSLLVLLSFLCVFLCLIRCVCASLGVYLLHHKQWSKYWDFNRSSRKHLLL